MKKIITKKCTKCGKLKSTSKFYRDKNTANGLSYWCKTCQAAGQKKRYAELPEKARAKSAKWAAEHPEAVRASKAKHRKKHPEKNRAHARKWYAEHRDEINARKRNYRAEHLDDIRLLQRYNITSRDYDKLLAAQNGRCAICRKPPNGRRLSVDHDHVTGKVRGLLCQKCNAILGLADDSIAILIEATEYLNSKGV